MITIQRGGDCDDGGDGYSDDEMTTTMTMTMTTTTTTTTIMIRKISLKRKNYDSVFTNLMEGTAEHRERFHPEGMRQPVICYLQ